jgi:hypothetical protein
MNWPSGVQWEWALGDFALLAFLLWELKKLKRAKAETRRRMALENAARSLRQADEP